MENLLILDTYKVMTKWLNKGIGPY